MKSLGRVALAISTLAYGSVAYASATAMYVAQAQGGTGDGSSCANAKAVSFFNSGASWGAGATQIGPGTTVHLCGTVTTALKVSGSGNTTAPITMQWETGASLSVCDTTGAVQVNNISYLVLDLGGNATAIECPNNGTGMATQTIAIGIGSGALSHSEIRNGTIGPIFQYSGTANQGVSSYSVTVASGGNNHFHHLTLKDANQGFYIPLAGTVADDEINNITMSNVGQGIWYALGSSGNVTGARIHDWDVTYGVNWAVPGDFTHTEVVHIFTQDAANNDIAVDIYNMYVHGTRPTSGYTADLFIDGSTAANHGTIKSNIYNNVLVSSGNSFPGDGAIFVAGTSNTVGIYNNTVDCGSKTTQGIGSEFETASSSYMYENNVFLNCNTALYNQASGPTLVVASAASLANTLPGKNLTSLGIAGLDGGKPITVGVAGMDVAVPRPASGAWTAGAYQYCAGADCEPVIDDGGGYGDDGVPGDGFYFEDASTPDGTTHMMGETVDMTHGPGCSCEVSNAGAPPSQLALLLTMLGVIGVAVRPRRKRATP